MSLIGQTTVEIKPPIPAKFYPVAIVCKSDEFSGSLFYQTKSYNFKSVEVQTAYPEPSVSFILNKDASYEMVCKFYLREWAFITGTAKMKVGEIVYDLSEVSKNTEVVGANHVYEVVIYSIPSTLLSSLSSIQDDVRVKFYGRKQTFVGTLDSSLFSVALKALVDQTDIFLGKQLVSPLTMRDRVAIATDQNVAEKAAGGKDCVWSYEESSDTLVAEIDISFMAETRITNVRDSFLSAPHRLRYWKQAGIKTVVFKNKKGISMSIPLSLIK
jgi:hypothetical protein